MENSRLQKRAFTSVNVTVGRRSREYLTEREVERLIEAAKQNRSGHRDATAILVAYRHGLRASYLVPLCWDDIDLATGRLHVRRAKGGDASVHPPNDVLIVSKNIDIIWLALHGRLAIITVVSTNTATPQTKANSSPPSGPFLSPLVAACRATNPKKGIYSGSRGARQSEVASLLRSARCRAAKG
jgi:Phage integrase family